MPEKEFHIVQRVNLIADNFRIKLKDGTEVYECKGDASKLGSQASFRTMDGVELACLKQTNNTKMIPWKNFVWYKDGKEWAIAKQEDWGALDEKGISIDIPGENDYKVVGDRMSWNFEVFKGDEKVGEISKKWGVIDNYGVTVADGADEVDVLLCGILVDQVYHDGEKKKKKRFG